MHRADAELARGLPASYDRALAVDGVGEVLDVWIPKITDVVKAPEVDAPVLLACTDRPERWLISPDPAGLGRYSVVEGPSMSQAQADAAASTVTGKAEDLLLVLWKRRQLEEHAQRPGRGRPPVPGLDTDTLTDPNPVRQSAGWSDRDLEVGES